MPYKATVIPVMIASPSDVYEYRSLARDVIHEWNYINSQSTNMVLMPVGWETHSSPELGSTAQELINDRVLEDCDLLLGVFWTRLGTPTGRSASGTAEEIERHVNAGKPAMIYFSTAPASLETVDHDQYVALKTFRKWCEGQGLIEVFSNPVEFNEKFRRQLQLSILKSPYIKSVISDSANDSGTKASAPPDTPPDDSSQESAKITLSTEAIALLREASNDRNGTVMTISTLAGKIIQTNSKNFTSQRDPRAVARWEYAINQLVSLGFLERTGTNSGVLKITEQGYRFADSLKEGT